MSKYFVAIVVYKATSSDKEDNSLFEESVVLVKASNKTEAEKEVNIVIKNREVSYRNEKGAIISWSLFKVIDINEMVGESISDITEVYSRHFYDIASYEKFEMLVGKRHD